MEVVNSKRGLLWKMIDHHAENGELKTSNYRKIIINILLNKNKKKDVKKAYMEKYRNG